MRALSYAGFVDKITTSYQQLLSLWLMLGWLTVWPNFCQPRERSRALGPMGMTSREMQPRPRPRWSDAAMGGQA